MNIKIRDLYFYRIRIEDYENEIFVPKTNVNLRF